MIKSLKVFGVLALVLGTFVSPDVKPAYAVNGYPLTPFYQVAGKYYLSTDGLGTALASGTLQVDKPSSSAVVKKAFLMSSSFGGSNSTPTAPTLEGTVVTYSKTVSGQTLADVTSIVTTKIDVANAGIVNLDITNANTAEGYALAVVFSDPAMTYSASVVLSFGRADTVGSSTKFDFSNVLSKQSYMDVTMSIGISYSYQTGVASNSYSCITSSGCVQFSRISLTLDNSNTPIYVSGTAGGADDANGSPQNGNLLTVGGVGDQVSKPVDSTSSTTTTTPIDNELYSLIDLLPNGTNSFTLNSVNPSANDYLFFAGFYFKGIVARGTDTSGTSSLPVITSVSPCFGPTAGGTAVTLTGTNLSGATSVKFGANSATINSNTATSLGVTAPAGSAGFIDVEVTTGAGSAIQFDGFQYGNSLTACDGSVEAAVNASPNPAPGVPAKPTATLSGTTATVAVTAGQSGGTPTSYTVTSSPGGFTCTVTGASGSCNIAGLAAGTSYTFTAVASNGSGSSSASSASDPVTPGVNSSSSVVTETTTTPGTVTSTKTNYVKKKYTYAKPSASATASPSPTEVAPIATPSESAQSESSDSNSIANKSSQVSANDYGLLAVILGLIAAFLWFIAFRRKKDEQE